MKIRYFAMVRDATGKSEEERNAPAATLGVLVRDLIARYGVNFQKWVMEKGEMNGLSIILVNGRDARHTGFLETPLKPDDTVVIFPPLAGG